MLLLEFKSKLNLFSAVLFLFSVRSYLTPSPYHSLNSTSRMKYDDLWWNDVQIDAMCNTHHESPDFFCSHPTHTHHDDVGKGFLGGGRKTSWFFVWFENVITDLHRHVVSHAIITASPLVCRFIRLSFFFGATTSFDILKTDGKTMKWGIQKS